MTVIALKTTGSLPPLCCVPPASGSAFGYTSLAQALPPELPVYAFEAPGFDDDQAPVDSLTDLSAGYLTGLREIPTPGPYLLLGWSMGGTVAFDMACRLRAEGRDVAALILVDTLGPDITVPPPSGAELVHAFLVDSFGAEPPPEVDLDGLWAAAPPADRAPHLFAGLQRAGYLDPDLDADLLARRFDVFRASIEALRGYRPAGRHDGTLTLVKAADSPPEIHAGWDRLARHVETVTLPGDHFGMRQGEGLLALSRVVQGCLSRSPMPAPGRRAP